MYSTNGATMEHQKWCINYSTIVTIHRAVVQHNNYAMHHFPICLLCLQITLSSSFRPDFSRAEIMKIRWSQMISFMPWWLHLQSKTPWYLLDIMGGPEPVWIFWSSWEFNPSYSILQPIFQTINQLREQGEGITFSIFPKIYLICTVFNKCLYKTGIRHECFQRTFLGKQFK